MQEVLRTEGVSYRYAAEGAEAVSNVTVSIGQGEFVAILGHNGSGKSTLAKLFNALFVPSEGRVVVAGMPTSDENLAWDIRANCGMVFQNPDNQIVATVVEEDVAFGLENLGVEPAEIREKVDLALKTVGMTGYKLSAPHMLSGGQKQRVAIAGVLAMRPRAIVFDEATAMLDPSGRTEVMRVVKSLVRDDNITVVWITHFMDEAAQADRMIIMNDGVVSMDGPPRELFRDIESIRALGLDVPEMTELAWKLRAGGLTALPEGILTVEEMAEEICRLKSAI